MAEREVSNGLGRVLCESTAALKGLRIDGSSLMGYPEFDRLLEEVSRPIRAGKWVAGTAQEEADYIKQMGQQDESEDEWILAVDDESEGELDEKICKRCKERGLLLICDGCNGKFHLHCVDLTEIPKEDVWSCPRCELEGGLTDGEHDESEPDDSDVADNPTTNTSEGPEEDLYNDVFPDEGAEEAEADAEEQAHVSHQEITTGDFRAQSHANSRTLDGTVVFSDGDTKHIAHYLGKQYQELIVGSFFSS